MFRRTSLSLLTALVATLALAGTASADRDLRMAGRPATAKDLAKVVLCQPGEFCGWRHANLQGGLFHYDGDDTNLFNDRFERKDTNVIVAKQISSLLNAGYDTANTDDVLATTTRGRWCIRNGYVADFIGAWNDTITGYYWTNCDGH